MKLVVGSATVGRSKRLFRSYIMEYTVHYQTTGIFLTIQFIVLYCRQTDKIRIG